MNIIKEEYLWNKKQSGNVLIAAHRGTCGGNVIQNTCLAYENALLHGADMIEIDVIMSTDGEFYAFHNGQEKLVLGLDKDINQMTSQEIDSSPCVNQIGLVTDKKIERLGSILEQFRGRCLINIDRSWFYWKEVITYLDTFHMADQIVIKSPVDKDLLQTLQDSHSDIMYMPIVKTIKEWEMVNEYKFNLVAAELIFEDLNSPFLDKKFIEGLHDRHILAWANAITLDDTTILSAKLDDNNAITHSFDENWGKLVDMGFDIIQTDWPALVKQYLETRNS